MKAVWSFLAALILLPVPPLHAQQDVAGEFTHAGSTRRYVVRVPAGPEEPPRPLVVVLHGCTQDARQIALGTGFSAAGDSLRFLVLYPEQPSTVSPAKCWQWFDPAHQVRGSG